MRRLGLFVAAFVFLPLAGLRAGEAKPATETARPGPEMMKNYLLRLVGEAERRWIADYEARTTPEQIAAYQKESRERLVAALGGWPQRNPLNAQITGKIPRDGYVIEKVIFESQPHFYVTALVFMPDAARFTPPYPGVVIPCGHADSSKSHKTYQIMGAFLAKNGMAAIVYDPIDQTERMQYRGERGPYKPQRGEPVLDGVYGHQLAGAGCILLGQSLIRYMAWDTMRAIDYLQSRPEVDPKRIGCTGQSGGGILTAYMVALDDRIGAAAPSCYLNNLPLTLKTIGPQDAEHHTWAAMSAGPHQADFLMLRAPVPTLLCEGTKDYFQIEGAWEVIRHAKRLYTRMGFAERVDILENDAKHNYDRLQREGIARWMSRWLRGKDEPLVEPEIELITDQEAQCTPTGQVMDLPGARSIYDLHEIYNAELAKRRAALWAGEDRAKRLEQVRRTAVIRKLDELPAPRVVKGETIRRDGYRIEKLDLLPEEGIVLPAMLFKPEKPGDGRTIIYVHEKGVEADAAPGGPIEKLALSGARVLAVELRGTGASQRVARENWHHVGPDWDYVSTALLLGKTYVGMRAEDILTAARYAARELAGKENSGGLSPFSSDENRTVPFGSGGSPVGVELMAVGHVGVPSLHAAALEPELFDRVKLSQTLVSWTSVLEARLFYNQYVNVVHGALLEYDLPDLAAALGEKLLIEDPRDGAGKPIVQ